jgi:hypothetical protein
MFSATIVILACLVGCSTWVLGRRYERHLLRNFEPRRTHAMIEQELDFLLRRERDWAFTVEQIGLAFDKAVQSLDRGEYASFIEKKALKNFVVREFLNRMRDAGQKWRYEIRSGPTNEAAAVEFLGGVLDRVYTREQSIASAIQDIVKRLYFDLPQVHKQATGKIPVMPA